MKHLRRFSFGPPLLAAIVAVMASTAACTTMNCNVKDACRTGSAAQSGASATVAPRQGA